MKIKYFAWIRELTRNNEEYLDSNEIQNLKELKKFLSTKYSDLQKHFDLEILRFAVNQEYVVENIDLNEDDEIAVSGLREYLAKIKVSVPVSRIAKIKTSMQLVALAFLILSESGITIIPIISIGKIALWIAGILTLYTGYDYLKSGLKHF